MLDNSYPQAVYHEKASSKGRADCVIETARYVYIFVYKLDRLLVLIRDGYDQRLDGEEGRKLGVRN
jgi:hypothetical protein